MHHCPPGECKLKPQCKVTPTGKPNGAKFGAPESAPLLIGIENRELKNELWRIVEKFVLFW
jgi:hypothetical protein